MYRLSKFLISFFVFTAVAANAADVWPDPVDVQVGTETVAMKLDTLRKFDFMENQTEGDYDATDLPNTGVFGVEKHALENFVELIENNKLLNSFSIIELLEMMKAADVLILNDEQLINNLRSEFVAQAGHFDESEFLAMLNLNQISRSSRYSYIFDIADCGEFRDKCEELLDKSVVEICDYEFDTGFGPGTSFSRNVVFSDEGKYLIISNFYGRAKVFEVETGQELMEDIGVLMEHGCLATKISGNNHVINVSGSDAVIHNIVDGSEVCNFVGHTARINTANFSSCGRYVVTGAEDHTVRIWDAITGVCLHTMQDAALAGGVMSAKFSPCSTRVIAGYSDGRVAVWNANDGSNIQILADAHVDGSVLSVNFGVDLQKFVTCGTDGNVCIWTLGDGGYIKAFEKNNDRYPNNSVFFVDEDQKVIVNTGMSAYIIDPSTGVMTRLAHSITPESISGKLYFKSIGGAGNVTIEVCSFEDATVAHSLFGNDHKALAFGFNRNGRKMATVDKTGIAKVWSRISRCKQHILNYFLRKYEFDGSSVIKIADDSQLDDWLTELGPELKKLLISKNIVRYETKSQANLAVSAIIVTTFGIVSKMGDSGAAGWAKGAVLGVGCAAAGFAGWWLS